MSNSARRIKEQWFAFAIVAVAVADDKPNLLLAARHLLILSYRIGTATLIVFFSNASCFIPLKRRALVRSELDRVAEVK